MEVPMSESPAKPPVFHTARTRIAGGVFFQGILFLLLVLGLNYLGFHYYQRWDFSRSQEFRLAMQTRQILRSLRGEMKIKVFFSPTSLNYDGMIARDINSLMREIVFSGKPKVKLEMVDPSRNIARARELAQKHNFEPSENLLLLEYDQSTKIIPFREMADFDFTPAASGEPPKVVLFRGEQVLASAMLGLLNPEERVVYFLQGQGEPGLGEGTPISILLDYIRRQNMETRPLNLSAAKQVPPDASALFIVAPRYDLSEEDLKVLSDYWAEDGRLFVLLDPEAKTPNLHALVRSAGIVVHNDRVLRTVPLSFAIGILRDVTGVFVPKSDITARLAGVNAFFPDPVQSLSTPEKPQEGLRLRPLIEAAEPFWGETEYVTDEDKGVAYTDGVDRGYPVILAFSSDRSGVQDDRIELQAGKMIVVGSSRFLYDDIISGTTGDVANLDFVISGLNWMIDRNRLTGVLPKAPAEFRLSLTNAQLANLSLYTMVVIPGTVALLGLLVWWVRRK